MVYIIYGSHLDLLSVSLPHSQSPGMLTLRFGAERTPLSAGVDHFYGDSGNDYIHVEWIAGPEDSAKDVVACGSGTDKVWFSEGVDIVNATCEIKHPQ